MERTRKRDYEQLSAEEMVEDNKKKMAKKNSVRPLPNETWLLVVAWIKRIELEQSFSVACRRFNEIAHVRLHERSNLFPPSVDNTRCMRALGIHCEMAAGRSDAEGQSYEAVMKATVKQRLLRVKWAICPQIPWPNSALPENIVAMKRIDIFFFDAKVFAFFDRIRPLLAKEMHLQIVSMHQENAIAIEHIVPMCTGPILSLDIDIEDTVEFSAKFPQHWTKCQLLDLNVYGWKDGNGMAKMVDWLAERRDDGQPKLLKILSAAPLDSEFIGPIKQQFLTSTHQQTSFLIRLELFDAVEFCQINGHTGEQLELVKINEDEVLLTRCPIGSADEQGEMAKARAKLLSYHPTYDASVLHFSVHRIGNLDSIKKL